MIELDELYFKWLMEHFDHASPALIRLCALLDEREFRRRVGNDINRAVDGVNLRKRFVEDFEELDFSPNVTNEFFGRPCTWLEMLMALAEQLDFLYDGGVREQFMELVSNMGLFKVLFSSSKDPRKAELYDELDREAVCIATDRVDFNEFDRLGVGGLFPLTQDHGVDQREVEIWEQHAAYYIEKLEGVEWTSTY